MFDIIVDNEITDLRERARQGNYDSMLSLATCLSRGNYTRADPDKALKILDHLLECKIRIPFREVYWNAVVEKSRVLWERDENEAIDALMVELIRDMSASNPEDWNLRQMERAVIWLHNRRKDSQEQGMQE